MKHILRIFSILIILAMLFGPLSPLTTRTVMAGEDLTQGDFGETEALLTPPHIEAWVNQGIVEGHNWDLFTVITLSVNGEVVETKTVGEDTAEYVVFYDVHLVPGDEISMMGQVDGDESITKTLVVSTLEITDVDPETYHISGLAEPGTQVEVWACWEDGCTETRQETVERNGKWSTDSNDEGSLIYDLFADMQITAGQGDEDGNYTLFSEKLSTNEPDPVEETAASDPVEETAEPDPADHNNNGSANYGGLGLLASDLKSEILDLKRDKRKDGSGGAAATLPLTVDINTDPLLFGPSGPGLHTTPLIAGKNMDEFAGEVLIWNSREKLHIQVKPLNSWLINTIQIYVGIGPVPILKNGNPAQGEFQYKEDLDIPGSNYTLVLDLVDDLGFSWGQPYESLRIQNIAIHSDLVKLDPDAPAQGSKIRYLEEEGAWALGDGTFSGGRWAWWFKYELTHPQRGHFIDSPVGGLSFETPTHIGKTDESGGFDYFPGERIDL
ncbi:MAG: hypothetical protein KAH12_04760, partial [Anaerolineales bacterium]|nr:hypothetical protein [Anaerolineales bacterium]